MLTMRPMSGARRLRVSLVDDDESCRESLSALLDVLGYEVKVYASVEALLAARAGLDADCLLLDASTPGATGSDLLGTLRARPKELPFIFVTGYAGQELDRRLMAFGAIGCLHKPLDEDELISALKRATEVAQANAGR